MKQFTFLMIFILSATISHAQLKGYNNQPIKEMDKSMSHGAYNSFSTQLVGATKKVAEDEWKSFIKNYKGKTKKDRKSKEYFTDDAMITDLSDNAIDVYATFSNADTFTVATFWFNLGGAYLSTEMHPDRIPAAEGIIKAYAFEVNKQVARENVKVQEKHYKNLEKDLRGLEKDNAEYHEEIEEAKKKIAEMEQNIEANNKAQADKKKEIKEQGVVVEKATKHLSKYQ